MPFKGLLWLFTLIASLSGSAAIAQPADEGLDARIRVLKADVIRASADLYSIQEEVLDPAATRLQIFLSISDPESFRIEAIELQLDGTPVASHRYDNTERQGLADGGVQALYLGHLPLGDHKLTAIVSGQAENDRYLRRSITLDLQKKAGISAYQLVLKASAPTFEPRLDLRAL